MKLNKILHNQKGATLVGLSTSMVVGAVTMLAGITLIQSILSSFNKIQTAGNFETLATLASRATQRNDLCTKGFAASSFQPSASITSLGEVDNGTQKQAKFLFEIYTNKDAALPIAKNGSVSGTYTVDTIAAKILNLPANLSDYYDAETGAPTKSFSGEIALKAQIRTGQTAAQQQNVSIPVVLTFKKHPTDANKVVVANCNSFASATSFSSTTNQFYEDDFYAAINKSALQEACLSLGMEWSGATCKLKASTSFCALAQNSAGQAFEYKADVKKCRDPASTSVACPNGYIPVPKNSAYVSTDFCVAKFEMKNVGGVPKSEATGQAWVSITRDAAATACSTLGPEYHLIKNYEWQNIVRDVEGTVINWSGGAVKSGTLSIGNFSPVGNSVTDETDPCKFDASNSHAGCTTPSNANFKYKRTHTLSNGEVIWDLGGGVMEWTGTNGGGTIPNGTRDFTCNLSSAGDKYHFGTSQNYSSMCASVNSPRNYLGKIEGTGSSVILRGSAAGMEGGAWDDCTGIFYANTNSYWNANSQNNAGVGFRCAYNSDLSTVYGSGAP